MFCRQAHDWKLKKKSELLNIVSVPPREIKNSELTDITTKNKFTILIILKKIQKGKARKC